MKRPADIRQLLQRRFANQHRGWLEAGDQDVGWPLEIGLGIPTEMQTMQQPDTVRAWANEWRSWQGPGQVVWTERQWRALGSQRLPASLRLDGPGQVAAWVGQQHRWARAQQRNAELAARWPMLGKATGKFFHVLADYADEDYERLLATVSWLDANRHSGYYLRQLPVVGLDSKWVEARRSVVTELVAALRDQPVGTLDLHDLCGLKKAPQQIRIRLLDPRLRTLLGGLKDVAAPIDELAHLPLEVGHVLVVENLQTGLALEELPGTVVVMGLGYGVQMLAPLPWIQTARCLYWGDIDTHGFAILDKARGVIPRIESILMDEDTLLRHQQLWSTEPIQHGAAELPHLTATEADLYGKLKHNAFGQTVRLEQERVDWHWAWSVIQRTVHI